MSAGTLSLLDTAASLLVALVLGAAIGAERQYRERIASLRTNVLVAVGSAAFVEMGIRLGGAEGAMRVVANVVTGVGFLGAGLILKEGANIRGLNTAATVWCSAAVGACAGANMPLQAMVIAAFVLACNTALRPIGKLIDRLPERDAATEAHYDVTVTVPEAMAEDARAALAEALRAADYPVASWEQHARAGGEVELAAGLVATSAAPLELDGVVAGLRRRLPGASDAAWRRRRPG